MHFCFHVEGMRNKKPTEKSGVGCSVKCVYCKYQVWVQHNKSVVLFSMHGYSKLLVKETFFKVVSEPGLVDSFGQFRVSDPTKQHWKK